jgi:hypothetical protein
MHMQDFSRLLVVQCVQVGAHVDLSLIELRYVVKNSLGAVQAARGTQFDSHRVGVRDELRDIESSDVGKIGIRWVVPDSAQHLPAGQRAHRRNVNLPVVAA